MRLFSIAKPALGLALIGCLSLSASADPRGGHRSERHGNGNNYNQNYERHGNRRAAGYQNFPAQNTYGNPYVNNGNYARYPQVNSYSVPYNNGYYGAQPPYNYRNQNGYYPYQPNVGAGILNGVINSGILNRLIR